MCVVARAVTQAEWGVGEGVGKHWQLLNFSKQLGTASQVWVVRPFLGKPAAGSGQGVGSGGEARARCA